MKACDLIKNLKKFPPTMEVIITDSYNSMTWAGEFKIEEVDDTIAIVTGLDIPEYVE